MPSEPIAASDSEEFLSAEESVGGLALALEDLALTESRLALAAAPLPRSAGAVEDVRFYAVWLTFSGRAAERERPDERGVIYGLHPVAWRRVAWLCGGRYIRGRHRLRRYATLAEAVAGYEEEAERHRAPLPCVVRRRTRDDGAADEL